MLETNLVGGLLGGVLIGLASTVMMLFLGRITGISGILAGAISSRPVPISWRSAFLVGLVLGAILYQISNGNLQLQMQAQGFQLIIAGLLVGFGSRLGSGCTSGHGVCGVARLSKRSIIATLCFLSAAMLTVYVTRHVLS